MLKSLNIRNEIALAVESLRKLENIVIHHLPSHVGICGNERADLLALRQVELAEGLKAQKRHLLKELDHQQYIKLVKGFLMPRKSGDLFFKQYENNDEFIRLLTRYYTKAPALNEYLYRINVIKSDLWLIQILWQKRDIRSLPV